MAKTPKPVTPKSTFQIFHIEDKDDTKGRRIDSNSCSWVEKKYDDGYPSANAAEKALLEIAAYKDANKIFWFGHNFEIREVPIVIAPPPVKVARVLVLAQEISIVKSEVK